MDLGDYKKQFSDGDTPGWDAIDTAVNALYDGREPDFHLATIHKYNLGGPDPIDGVSVYRRRNPDHLHFVSYGFSELYYDEEEAETEFSGLGFELTFRLAMPFHTQPKTDEEFNYWPVNLIQNLARYLYESAKWFEHGHWIDAGGPIMADSRTDKVGLIFWRDPELAPIDTPHGSVEFLQMIGITAAELQALKDKQATSADIFANYANSDPLLLTGLNESD